MQANASLTVDELSSETYLRNNGYSKQTAEVITVSKARALGDEYYTEDEQAFRNQNKFVRFWRKAFMFTQIRQQKIIQCIIMTQTQLRHTQIYRLGVVLGLFYSSF